MYQPASALTFASAKTALGAGLQAINAGQSSIDLGGVTTVDSSAVAVLIAWQRAAKTKGISLGFVNTPHNLASLLVLYGVADLLFPADASHH